MVLEVVGEGLAAGGERVAVGVVGLGVEPVVGVVAVKLPDRCREMELVRGCGCPPGRGRSRPAVDRPRVGLMVSLVRR